jgi:MFS family permease
MIIFTLGEIVAMPTSVAYIAELAPAHMRGRYMGTSGLTWATALILGPALGMKTYALHPDGFWAACGSLALLAAVIISGAVKAKAVLPNVQETASP